MASLQVNPRENLMDTSSFFDSVRSSVFGGSLKQSQVDGLNLIVAEGDKRGVNNEYLAYILATAAHETAYTMQPIAEYGRGRGRKYGVPDPVTGQTYYGRGYVQLTWKFNYEKASKVLGVDFVRNPDLVMTPRHAVRILFQGMKEGWFTGKSLSDYLDGVDEDYREDLREFSNARRIVNGTDKQVQIGQLAIKFETALRTAQRPETGSDGGKVPETPEPRPEVPARPQEEPHILIRILRVLLRLIKALK